MYIESVPNRASPPAILLRESYRDGGKVKKRTLLNLSDWPRERIAGFKMLLKGGTVIPQDQNSITIIRSLPHGHVTAALGTARKIGLDRLLGPDGNRCRDLILALVVNRILDPGSKLAAARALSPDTATSSLGQQLGLGVVGEDELYSALDWLAVRQPAIEAALAKRHFTGGTLVLYDVSSGYLEGRCCSLAQFGYSRDGKRGKLQIVYGLLCATDGCPVAIEVFAGSTADPATLTSQVTKLRQRFGLDHVVLVGDRGMITQARITEDLKAAGLDWITALRAPAIKALRDAGALQMSLFDERDMAAITAPDFPGERLIVCRNRGLGAERARKREDLLLATERDLARIAAAVARKRRPLRGQAEIGIAVGAVIDQHKMAKHFALAITDTCFTFTRKANEITAEAALDGIYIVRAHVFLCMLAYYLEWHMRQRLAPMLYDDTEKDAAEALRASVVAKAERSASAITKQTTGRTEDGLPVHSFRTLLADLATLTRNTLVTALDPQHTLTLTARPTPLQQKAQDLLGLVRTQ